MRIGLNIGKEILSTTKQWFSDGTFSTAPSPYSQIYVIFGELASGKTLPCFYALLPNKEQATYKKMWRVLYTALGHDIRVESIMMDMEVSVSNSLTRVFGPDITITICYFHPRKA